MGREGLRPQAEPEAGRQHRRPCPGSPGGAPSGLPIGWAPGTTVGFRNRAFYPQPVSPLWKAVPWHPGVGPPTNPWPGRQGRAEPGSAVAAPPGRGVEILT